MGGQVVGYSRLEGYFHRAFRTAPNQPINPATDNLGSLAGTSSMGYAINNAGQVVGVSPPAGPGNGHAFRTAPNQPINPATDDLGYLSEHYSEARGINETGHVIGSSLGRAFRTEPNQPINPGTDDLGTLGSTGSYAYGINNAGQVVGCSYTAAVQRHAFLHEHGTMKDLNDLIAPTSGWELRAAGAINQAGQIVGSGIKDGQTRAFLLTPVNQAPAVNAGPDQSITLPISTVSLSGAVSDDGLPNPPGAVTLTWTHAAGPGTVAFADAHALDTTATFVLSGTYVLRLTAGDSTLSVWDDVEIIVLKDLRADFHNDGKVDGLDFLRWQANFNRWPAGGADKTHGDATGDGKVDGLDFLLWQAGLGR